MRYDPDPPKPRLPAATGPHNVMPGAAWDDYLGCAVWHLPDKKLLYQHPDGYWRYHPPVDPVVDSG